MRIAVALLAVMLPFQAHAVDVGQSYAEARAELIADGWVPVKADGPAEKRCYARKEICETYAEAGNCAPTGLGACFFVFSKSGKTMSVSTENEDLDDLVVSGWE